MLIYLPRSQDFLAQDIIKANQKGPESESESEVNLPCVQTTPPSGNPHLLYMLRGIFSEENN